MMHESNRKTTCERSLSLSFAEIGCFPFCDIAWCIAQGMEKKTCTSRFFCSLRGVLHAGQQEGRVCAHRQVGHRNW